MSTPIAPAVLLGRIALALIFILSGLGKIFDFTGTTEYMADHGMPAASILLVGAIVFEIAGGLSVLLGFKARLGAVLLLVFLVPASLIFHNFWAIEGDGQEIQMIMFMKNLSIGGGLLFLLGTGAGPLSLDARADSKQ